MVDRSAWKGILVRTVSATSVRSGGAGTEGFIREDYSEDSVGCHVKSTNGQLHMGVGWKNRSIGVALLIDLSKRIPCKCEMCVKEFNVRTSAKPAGKTIHLRSSNPCVS